MTQLCVLFLLNTCYFKILPILAKGLSLDTPFHLGNMVTITMEPVMSPSRVGTKGKELLHLNIHHKTSCCLIMTLIHAELHSLLLLYIFYNLG
jgi:hypothetical protein